MNAIGHRLIETASLFLLVFLCLWLTLFVISGNFTYVFFIPLLAVVFAGAKEPYRRRFIVTCLIVGVFLIYPVEIGIRRGDKLQVKVRPIVYGLLAARDCEEVERNGAIAGGCVVSPFSARWRIQVIVP
jgi:energy-coupling factor transporter transmembrane protein EcfT